MRIGYSEDEDYPGQFELWQANCRRSLQGKAGQASLRELEQALLALPKKRLIANRLKDADGEVCALGALAEYKGREIPVSDADDFSEWEDFGEMEDFGVQLGVPRLVAWKVVELNDVVIDGRYDYSKSPRGEYVPCIPEERYEKVLAWVRKRLARARDAGIQTKR